MKHVQLDFDFDLKPIRASKNQTDISSGQSKREKALSEYEAFVAKLSQKDRQTVQDLIEENPSTPSLLLTKVKKRLQADPATTRKPWQLTREEFAKTVEFGYYQSKDGDRNRRLFAVYGTSRTDDIPQKSGKLTKPKSEVIEDLHRRAIEARLETNKRAKLPNALPYEKVREIPAKVLAQYPDLIKKGPVQAATNIPAAPQSKREKALAEYQAYFDSLSQEDLQKVWHLKENNPKVPSLTLQKIKRYLAQQAQPDIFDLMQGQNSEDKAPAPKPQTQSPPGASFDTQIKTENVAAQVQGSKDPGAKVDALQAKVELYWRKELTAHGRQELLESIGLPSKAASQKRQTDWKWLDQATKERLTQKIQSDPKHSNTQGAKDERTVGAGTQKAAANPDDRGGAKDQSAEAVQSASKQGSSSNVSRKQRSDADGGLRPGLQRGRNEDSANPTPKSLGENAADRAGSDQSVESSPGNLAGVQRRSKRPGTDFRIPNGGLTREGGWKTAAKNNLDAIELYKKISAEGRPATTEEQKVLSKYVGWGASEVANKMFPGFSRFGEVYKNWADEGWQELVERATKLLSPEEIQSAAKSTQYAHYTSEDVIRSIYGALEKFGFDGGKVLEPGVGVGNFVGTIPENMHKNSIYTGIEMDHVSAGIAKLLYPQQNIQQGDFTKSKLPDNFFDVAIGNPPFSSTKILADPDYARHRFPLHNYFFAKSMDKVRPGGMVVFVSSRYTMDSENSKIRDYLSEQADLVGAVRLPQTAFKQNAGTEVVTDVLFLRKRLEGEPPAGKEWSKLAPVQVGEHTYGINQYFVDHPEMVLGKHASSGTMYSANEYSVDPPTEEDLKTVFERAVEHFPENIYTKATKSATVERQAAIHQDFDPKTKKEGSLYIDDEGRLMQVDFGVGVPAESLHKLNRKQLDWLKDYVPLRDRLKESHFAQLSDGDWQPALAALKQTYDAFVKKHGPILNYSTREYKSVDEDGNTQVLERRQFKNNKLLRVDVEGSLIMALEDITETGDIVQTPTLYERTLMPPKRQEINSVYDALSVSLDEIGALDIDHVAKLAGVTPTDAVEQLGDQVYVDPERQDWVLVDEYLSGNVVDKLEKAVAAAEIDPRLQRNVEALKLVQPEALTAKDITVNAGANWIPVDYYTQFAREVLDLPRGSVEYTPADNSWAVGGVPGRQSQRSSDNEWATPDRGPNEIFEAVLNNQTIRITRTDRETRKTFVDTAATTSANAIAENLRKRFSSWVWEDAERAGNLLEIYNRKFNVIAPRKFSGDHLTLPGTSLKFPLYDHQKRAVWRILQTGDTYLAHAVGAGKTFTMIAAGMEQKRLGMIRKPLYVVPNHMLQQFSNEFQMLYPTAKVLVADETNFHTENRRRFVARAALNNPDAIVMTHSSFGLLGMKPETIQPVRNKVLNELREAYSEMEDSDEPKFKLKRMEKRIEQAEQRFDSMIASKDDSIAFEDLGVDFMFVDEAHMFRKLDFTTSRQAKGIDPNGSKRAMDLFIKTKHLAEQNPGRSHVFASGTPITNTLGELFTLERFFNENGLERDNLNHFDAWANNYGMLAQGFEMNAAGKYEIVERFAKFVNVPELMERVRVHMDVLTNSQLGERIARPEIENGTAEIVVTPPSETLKKYQQEVLQPRIERSKDWKPTREQPGNPDPIINIITDGRLASIDMRFVAPRTENDPGSKLNKFIDGIIESYHKTAANEYLDPETGKASMIQGGSQIVFYNHGFGKQVAASRGFDGRAWVMQRLKAAGIPGDQVAWIDDYSGTKKEAVFQKVRQGEIRILIGSAKKMGTGVNVQNRLTHLHYLDPPWYPADVEQPDGRIVRQGNQNKMVSLKRYATKGSYDATMWQMVARKSQFIEQAFTGDRSVRTLEDISESSQYEMAAALASGDERVIQLAGLRADVERLNQLKIAHDDKQRNLWIQKRETEFGIKRLTERIKIYEAVNDKCHYVNMGYNFIGVLENKHFTGSQTEFGQKLASVHNRTCAQLIQKTDKGKSAHEVIGAVNGIKLSSEILKVKDTAAVLRLTLDLHEKISITIAEGKLEFATPEAARGLVSKITNQIYGIGSEISRMKRELSEHERKLERTNKVFGAPFELEGELREKTAEVANLELALATEGQTQTTGNSNAVELTNLQTYKLTNFKVSNHHNDALTVQLREAIQTKISLDQTPGMDRGNLVAAIGNRMAAANQLSAGKTNGFALGGGQ